MTKTVPSPLFTVEPALKRIIPSQKSAPGNSISDQPPIGSDHQPFLTVTNRPNYLGLKMEVFPFPYVHDQSTQAPPPSIGSHQKRNNLMANWMCARNARRGSPWRGRIAIRYACVLLGRLKLIPQTNDGPRTGAVYLSLHRSTCYIIHSGSGRWIGLAS